MTRGDTMYLAIPTSRGDRLYNGEKCYTPMPPRVWEPTCASSNLAKTLAVVGIVYERKNRAE